MSERMTIDSLPAAAQVVWLRAIIASALAAAESPLDKPADQGLADVTRLLHQADAGRALPRFEG